MPEELPPENARTLRVIIVCGTIATLAFFVFVSVIAYTDALAQCPA